MQIIKGLRLRPKSALLEGRSLPDRAIRSFWIGGRTNHRDNLGLRDGQHRNFGSVNDLERYATREPLGHCTVAPSPQHNDIDSAGVRDADYLRRSATDGDDRFKLFTPLLPRPTLCCFDDVSSETFQNSIHGQDAAPFSEKVF